MEKSIFLKFLIIFTYIFFDLECASQKLDFSFNPSMRLCSNSAIRGSSVAFDATINASGLSLDEVTNSMFGIYYANNKAFCDVKMKNENCISNDVKCSFECFKENQYVYKIMISVKMDPYSFYDAPNICLLWNNTITTKNTKTCLYLFIYDTRLQFGNAWISVHYPYYNLTFLPQMSSFTHGLTYPLAVYLSSYNPYFILSVFTDVDTVLFRENVTTVGDRRYFVQNYSDTNKDMIFAVRGPGCIRFAYKCKYIGSQIPRCGQHTLINYGGYSELRFSCFFYEWQNGPSLNFEDKSVTAKMIEKNYRQVNQSIPFDMTKSFIFDMRWNITSSGGNVKNIQNLKYSMDEAIGTPFYSDCNEIVPFWDENPVNVTLSADCPKGPAVKNGYIKRGTTAECVCVLLRTTFQPATMNWLTADGQVVNLKNKTVLEVAYNSSEPNQYYTCRATSLLGVNTSVQFIPKYYYGPRVVKFDANDSRSVNVSVGASVIFHCEVEGDPPAKALINGSGIGQLKEIMSNTSVLIYPLNNLQPNDTGRYFCMGVNGFEDSETFIQNVVKVTVLYTPNVSLSADCPRGPGVKNGYIRRGTTAECGCYVHNNESRPAIVKWFDANGLQIITKVYSILEVVYSSNETTHRYQCRATSLLGEEKLVQFVARFYDEPRILNFTVNNTSSVNVTVGASVVFYCKVDGSPPAKALINGSGLGQVKEIQSNTSVLELVLEDLQCEDSGRYFCMGVNGFEDMGTMVHTFVDINIVCELKVRYPPPEIPVVLVTRDKNTVFTLEIYGYPEPTKFGLKTEIGNSRTDLDNKTYQITYMTTTPPFGLVTVTLFDESTKAVSTYILSLTNTEGNMEFKFDVVNQFIDTKSPDDTMFPTNLGVGIGCSVLAVAAAIVVAIFCVRRRRIQKESENKKRHLQRADETTSKTSETTSKTPETSTDNHLYMNMSYSVDNYNYNIDSSMSKS